MRKYQIWDKKSPVLTPSGAMFTAEQWIAKYPIAALDSIQVVLAAGEINGALFATLGQMIERAEAEGCVIDVNLTADEKLLAIETFENNRAAEEAAKAAEEAANKALQDEINTSSMASIAASMEYQNMLTLEDVN